MAPTEELILRSFLVQKAALRDIVTLAEFSASFPSAKRSSSLIRDLYRDLQTQRSAISETVLKQINLECRLGEALLAKKWTTQHYLQAIDSTNVAAALDTHVFLT